MRKKENQVSKEAIIDIIKKIKKEVRKAPLPLTTKIGGTNGAFEVLISTALSPQTKDTVTEPAFKRLMEIADTPEKIINTNIKKIEKAIYPVSFYKTKAKRVKEICKILLKKYKGKVPNTMQKLCDLPGVGRKVAGLTLIYGFNKTVSIPVDTHVHRISNWLNLVKTKDPEKTEKALMKIIPKKYWKDFNNNLVQFGQNLCKPVNPHCHKCPLTKYCNYYKEIYLIKNKNNKN